VGEDRERKRKVEKCGWEGEERKRREAKCRNREMWLRGGKRERELGELFPDDAAAVKRGTCHSPQ
jgi:hypothetical protein